MNVRSAMWAIAALAITPNIASAASTINFNGEITSQTCSAVVNGVAEPTVLLNSVPVGALNGNAGSVAGETTFSLRLTGCVAPAQNDQTFEVIFQAINPTTAAGNLANAATGGATGVALQILDRPGGTRLNLAGNAVVTAGTISLPAGQTAASADYAVRYVAEESTVTVGPVLSSVTYTVRYE
ncbi:fimbrial protein [Pseudomonas cremoricolorata]|uniref:Fimbrial protein n=1 Tax=Pseudomonas cremoricolorata TaxID=157783 RepID=A0A089YJ44_9PSED|nr:fimbrial protein [Pseudomonas cremoricolorata]AIR91673.1 fimbrial protein [Pseudomonas cremoricolorata]